jgi:hypothetical protein
MRKKRLDTFIGKEKRRRKRHKHRNKNVKNAIKTLTVHRKGKTEKNRRKMRKKEKREKFVNVCNTKCETRCRQC